MTDADQIFQAIRDLPVRERLRLVERVVHDLADTSEPMQQLPSPLGLFADDPDGVDEMMKVVMENRRRWKLRAPRSLTARTATLQGSLYGISMGSSTGARR